MMAVLRRTTPIFINAVIQELRSECRLTAPFGMLFFLQAVKSSSQIALAKTTNLGNQDVYASLLTLCEISDLSLCFCDILFIGRSLTLEKIYVTHASCRSRGC